MALIVTVTPSGAGAASGLGSWEQRVSSGAVVGRDPAACELRLSGWRVGAQHARLLRTAAGVLIEDLGSLSGIRVDGRRIQGLQGPVSATTVLGVGPYELRVREQPTVGQTEVGPPGWTAADAGRAPDLRTDGLARAACPESPMRSPARDPDPHLAENASSPVPGEASSPALGVVWRRRIHARLLETMDLRRQDISAMSDERLRQETGVLLDRIVADLQDELPPGLDRTLLQAEVLDEAVGLGPLEALLADETVSEVMVNRHDQIFVERGGRLERHPLVFSDDRAVMAVIERIVAPIGRRIDESSPMVDARLRDGSRVHAVIPPLALKGPCITVRKFARRAWSAEDLVRMGSMSAGMSAFLRLCVLARRNVVVSGGTGSGKTTLLNVLSNHIPLGERVITVEDAAELQLQHPHLVSLEARPPNSEGKGAVSIRELVRNTLRMRPDRIVVGECRGPEALDMLQAMNTGHEGSLTTLHANTPRDALARLEILVLMAGMDLPLAAIREQIASAVDIVVQQTRFACGLRAVTSITEVTGIESGTLQTQELFRFQVLRPGSVHHATQGRFAACDAIPECLDAIRSFGLDPDPALFSSRASREVLA